MSVPAFADIAKSANDVRSHTTASPARHLSELAAVCASTCLPLNPRPFSSSTRTSTTSRPAPLRSSPTPPTMSPSRSPARAATTRSPAERYVCHIPLCPLEAVGSCRKLPDASNCPVPRRLTAHPDENRSRANTPISLWVRPTPTPTPSPATLKLKVPPTQAHIKLDPSRADALKMRRRRGAEQQDHPRNQAHPTSSLSRAEDRLYAVTRSMSQRCSTPATRGYKC